MDDTNKASLGLTPMRIAFDTSLYSKGSYAETEKTVAVMVKWNAVEYENVYRYYILIWQNPSWYVGNVLYQMRLGSDLTDAMARTVKIIYELQPTRTSYTIEDLTTGAEYYMAITAQADTGYGYLSDVYITKFTADWDRKTPKIHTIVPFYKENEYDYINVMWSRYAGYRPDHYTLFVWTGNQDWYNGDGWYKVSEDRALAERMAATATFSRDTALTTLGHNIAPLKNVVTYYFGVMSWSNFSDDGTTFTISDIYVMQFNVVDTWKWIPRGEISESIDWGTNVIDFETGVKQYQQKYTKPTRIFTATFSGLAKTWAEMRDFINAHKGNLLPFYIWIDEYDRVSRYCVRLTESKYNPKFQTEVIYKRTTDGLAGRKTIGFTIDLSFIEAKEQPILQILPNPEPTYDPPDDDTAYFDDTTSEDTTSEDTTDDLTHAPSLDDDTSADDTTSSIDDTTSIEDDTSVEDDTSEDTTREDSTTDEWGIVLVQTGDTYGHWSVVGGSTHDTVENYEFDPSADEWGAILYQTGDTYGHWSIVSGSEFDDTEDDFTADADGAEYGVILIATGDTYGHWSIVSGSNYDTDGGDEKYKSAPDEKEWGVVLLMTADTYGHWSIVGGSEFDDTEDDKYESHSDGKENGVILMTAGDTYGSWQLTTDSSYEKEDDFKYTPDGKESGIKLTESGNSYGTWQIMT